MQDIALLSKKGRFRFYKEVRRLVRKGLKEKAKTMGFKGSVGKAGLPFYLLGSRKGFEFFGLSPNINRDPQYTGLPTPRSKKFKKKEKRPHIKIGSQFYTLKQHYNTVTSISKEIENDNPQDFKRFFAMKKAKKRPIFGVRSNGDLEFIHSVRSVASELWERGEIEELIEQAADEAFEKFKEMRQ